MKFIIFHLVLHHSGLNNTNIQRDVLPICRSQRSNQQNRTSLFFTIFDSSFPPQTSHRRLLMAWHNLYQIIRCQMKNLSLLKQIMKLLIVYEMHIYLIPDELFSFFQLSVALNMIIQWLILCLSMMPITAYVFTNNSRRFLSISDKVYKAKQFYLLEIISCTIVINFS